MLLTHEIIKRALTKSIPPSLQISQLIIVNYDEARIYGNTALRYMHAQQFNEEH